MEDVPITEVDISEKKSKEKKPRKPGSGVGSGGFRPGAGRRKGSKNVKTILKSEAYEEMKQKWLLKEQIKNILPLSLQRDQEALKAALTEINEEEVEETFKKRIHLHSNKLLTAMLTAAMGEQFLYKVVILDDGNGKYKKRHVQVTDPEEIQYYLDNPLEVEGSDYYYISKKSPDITAINSLLDRMMGRPTTKVVGPNNPDGSEGPIRVISVNFSPPQQQIEQPKEPIRVVAEVIKDVIEQENGDTTTS